MKTIQTGGVTLIDCEPAVASFRDEVLAGLAASPKSLPCKFFYDERGSALFDRICALPEYYPTRTELRILRDHKDDIVAALGRRCRLVELGSGSSVKTRILLDNAEDLAAYVPIDISRDHLLKTAIDLADDYQDVPVQPVCADYGQLIAELPQPRTFERTVVYFPGSTIGNFEAGEAETFLRRIAILSGEHGGMLIGVDLDKDPAVLHAAYNDRMGVTAQFNLNLLRRIDDELGGTFDLAAFEHRAFYDRRQRRIEMQLVSRCEQVVEVAGEAFRFAAGEAITTEYSHKYTPDSFRALARRAGFEVRRVWTDPERLFSVQYCERC